MRLVVVLNLEAAEKALVSRKAAHIVDLLRWCPAWDRG